MDNCNEENVDAKWVFVNPVDTAEEVTENTNIDDSKRTPIESDMESDGISIISEGSHLNESNEEECFQCEKDTHFTNEPIIWTLSDSETRVPVPVFVYPNHPPEEIYSNYMKDLVQEIAEHELGSIQSDQESNEIASISKPRIDNLGKNALSKLKKENMENVKLELISYISSVINKYFNGFVIGTILFASLSMFLGRSFSSVDQIEENFEHFLNSSDQIDGISKKYNVSTTLYFCEYKYRSDNVSMEKNVHKCLFQIEERLKKKQEHMKEEEIKELEKKLRIKERYLNEKEKFLIQREYELLRVEMKFKSKHPKKGKHIKNEMDIEKEVNTNLKSENGHKPFENGFDLNSDNIFRKQNKVQIHKRNKKRNNEQNYNEKSSKDYWRNKKSKVKEYDSTEGLKGHYDKIKMKYFKNLPKNKFVEQKNKLDKTSGTKKRSYDQDSEERRRADHKNSLISS